jgi:membrane-associated protease RseP (regulator of RpoE activity)
MDEPAAYGESPSVLTEIPRLAPHEARVVPAAGIPALPPLNVALFLITLLTTTMAGAYMEGAELSIWHPLASLPMLASGLSFSIPLMAILLAHEMGHYVTSRRYGVDTSLPYFIPAPFPSIFLIGTFGAFIRMRSRPATRRVMFDIGAAGPWAGMAVALPCVIIGLALSHETPASVQGGLNFGNSLLFGWLTSWIMGVDPSVANVSLHPIAFAGWLGFFVTTLNLLPVGQFDGGHVIYALFPHHHRRISSLFVLSCVLLAVVPFLLGWNFWGGWLLWALLAIVLGLGHPSTVDRDTPLGFRRRLAAWATVALFILTFTPVPVSLTAPTQPQSTKPTWVMRHVPERGAHSQEPVRARI